jgi:hypothetical protein
MILYVNGDSNAAAAEAVNPYAFANDDPLYWGLGRRPHPDNERVSWGCNIANELGAILHCDAESASSNARIARTTDHYLKYNPKPDLVIIGWSTWEREEWLHDSIYWQVNAGGVGEDWPEQIKNKYKKWVIDIDYQAAINKAHRSIHNYHLKLMDEGVNHFFFTCFEPFHDVEELDWHGCYLEPYNLEYTFYNWLLANGFKTVKKDSYHFGADAHWAWAKFLSPNITKSLLTKPR